MGPQLRMKLLYFEKPKLICNAFIKVVNDAAEHSIALMSYFNQSMTKTESEMQKLIQVVEDNRKHTTDYRKGSLVVYVPW